MSLTTTFVSALLRANKTAQADFYSKQIPLGLFKEDAAIVSWLYTYREQHGSYPSRLAFKQRFPAVKLVKRDTTVEAALQPLLDADLFEQTSKVIDSARKAYAEGQPISKALAILRTAVGSIRDYDTRYRDLSVFASDDVVRNYLNRVRMRQDSPHALDPTPWKTFNQLMQFSEPGEHTIIGSRTSIGKSWLSLYWAWHQAQQGEHVLFITKEMSTAQVAMRLESIIYKLPYPKFRGANLAPRDLRRWREERKKASREYERSARSRFIISGHETLEGVGFAHLYTKIQEHQPTVLWVDGAYLIVPEGVSKNASPVERLTMISNTLKRLCLAYKIKGFSSVQLNRDSEDGEGDTKPSLKNIFGADAWAQDSDFVILVGGKRDGKTRLLSMQKGRESAIGDLHVRFQLDPFPSFAETQTLDSLKSTQPLVQSL